MRNWLLLLLVLGFAFALAPASLAQAPAAAPRLALLIANTGYTEPEWALERPDDDADAMKTSLEAMGFKVTRVYDSPDKAGIERAVESFAAALRKAGPSAIGFVYYAGHGMADRAGGGNFIVPLDATRNSVARIGETGVALDFVIQRLEAVGNRANIVVFDACRTPAADTERTAVQIAGWAKERDPGTGTLVAFAQSKDLTALDNGAYAETLAGALREPGLSLEEAFDKVQVAISVRTRGAQAPVMQEQVLERICLAGCERPTTVARSLEAATDALARADLAAIKALAAAGLNGVEIETALGQTLPSGETVAQAMFRATAQQRSGKAVIEALAGAGLDPNLLVKMTEDDRTFQVGLLWRAVEAADGDAVIALLAAGAFPNAFFEGVGLRSWSNGIDLLPMIWPQVQVGLSFSDEAERARVLKAMAAAGMVLPYAPRSYTAKGEVREGYADFYPDAARGYEVGTKALGSVKTNQCKADPLADPRIPAAWKTALKGLTPAFGYEGPDRGQFTNEPLPGHFQIDGFLTATKTSAYFLISYMNIDYYDGPARRQYGYLAFTDKGETARLIYFQEYGFGSWGCRWSVPDALSPKGASENYGDRTQCYVPLRFVVTKPAGRTVLEHRRSGGWGPYPWKGETACLDQDKEMIAAMAKVGAQQAAAAAQRAEERKKQEEQQKAAAAARVAREALRKKEEAALAKMEEDYKARVAEVELRRKNGGLSPADANKETATLYKWRTEQRAAIRAAHQPDASPQ